VEKEILAEYRKALEQEGGEISTEFSEFPEGE